MNVTHLQACCFHSMPKRNSLVQAPLPVGIRSQSNSRPYSLSDCHKNCGIMQWILLSSHLQSQATCTNALQAHADAAGRQAHQIAAVVCMSYCRKPVQDVQC